MPFDVETALTSPTGASLHLYVRRAGDRPRAVVHIIHGFAEHARRYERFADFLAAQGIASCAHDHRGHGHTTAPDAPLGRFGTPQGADKVIADVLAVNDRIGQDHPGVPIIIFGHSMGGLIALNFVLSHPDRVHAAAIWNANFSAGLMGRVAIAVLAWERFRLGSDVAARIPPRLTFQAWGKSVPGHVTPFDWLSRDAEEVKKYIDDPLCGWDASVSMWRDVFTFVFRGADDRNFSRVPRDLPFNLVGGGQDPATDGGKAVRDLERRMRRMGFSNLVSTIYPESRHESLNELNRDAIMADFARWVDTILSH